MKKNSNKIVMTTNELASGDHINNDIEMVGHSADHELVLR